mmetsp:Transcript_18992/g.31134  ORF Transcript_18992/g.31134 Transcript_18992/m.31134 type:complete len:1083 (-) Transcript_18992:172-3420(-)
MDELITVVNRLQDVLSGIGISTSDIIDLPQIAVVGSQSSGKSSVLESFVGKQFLPRGSGLVTRRPLVLQLFSVSPGEPEYGEFLHRPGAKYYNFNDICQEIVADTDRVAGKNAGIVNAPINLRVYSPDVVNLTLIDLPGLTKVPVGDQPPDIELQIRSMINSFISRPNCIILAVTAANTDIANSDALQLAKAVDPAGERTVGVITKLDLMDQGTDAKDVLLGKVYPLKKGYIGVVNRSQLDINKNKSIRDALDAERAFFQSHPTYSQMMNILGTRVLAKTLNKILVHHIKVCLPDIRKSVNEKLAKVSAELEELGGPVSSMSDKKSMLVAILNAYSREFRNAIEGRSVDMNIKELYGGARIAYIFRDIFGPAIHAIDPCLGLRDEDIRNAMRNSTGVGGSLFMPRVVNSVIQRQMARLKEPSIECTKYVLDELVRIASTVNKKRFARFEDLRALVLNEMSKFLQDLFAKTVVKIEAFLELQMAFINLEHPDCINTLDALNQVDMMKKKKTVMSYVPDSVKETVHKKEYNQPTATVASVSANLRSGFLYKQGATMKAWKKRFFNYDGVYLLQFASDAKGEKAKSSTQMRNSSVKALDPRQFDGWCFQIKTPDKILILKADTEDEMKKWVISLQSNAGPSRDDQQSPPPASPNEETKKKEKDKKEEDGGPPPKVPGKGNNLLAAGKAMLHNMSGKPKATSHVRQKTRRRRGGSLTSRYFVPDDLMVHLPEVPYSIRPPINPAELRQTELVKAILRSYFDIIRKTIRDAIPKAIMCFLVLKAKEELQFTLGALFSRQSVEDILKESGAVAAQREQLDKEQQALKKAVAILEEVENIPLDKASVEPPTAAPEPQMSSQRPRPPSPPPSYSSIQPPAPYNPAPPLAPYNPAPPPVTYAPQNVYAPPPPLFASSSARLPVLPPAPVSSYSSAAYNIPPPLPLAPSINAPPPVPARVVSPGPAPSTLPPSFAYSQPQGFGLGSPIKPAPPQPVNPFLPAGGPPLPAFPTMQAPLSASSAQPSSLAQASSFLAAYGSSAPRPAAPITPTLPIPFASAQPPPAPAASATATSPNPAQNVDWMKMFQSAAKK